MRCLEWKFVSACFWDVHFELIIWVFKFFFQPSLQAKPFQLSSLMQTGKHFLLSLRFWLCDYFSFFFHVEESWNSLILYGSVVNMELFDAGYSVKKNVCEGNFNRLDLCSFRADVLGFRNFFSNPVFQWKYFNFPVLGKLGNTFCYLCGFDFVSNCLSFSCWGQLKFVEYVYFICKGGTFCFCLFS